MKTKFDYIEWTSDLFREYCVDKEGIDRTLHPNEIEMLSRFIRKNNFKRMFDLGTWTGISGYVIATSSKETEILVSLDWGELYNAYLTGILDEEKNKLFGKYLPKGSIYINDDFNVRMHQLMRKYKFDFALIDDGHGTETVNLQILICYRNKVPYIAVHDYNKEKVKIAVDNNINNDKYRIIEQDLESSKLQGLVILERVN